MGRVRWFILGLVLAIATDHGALAASVHDLVKDFSAPRPGKTWQVQSITVDAGHASLLLEEGRVTEMRSKDRLVALYFQGKGKFEYATPDASEFALLQHNATRNTDLKPVREAERLVLREAVREAVIWVGGRQIPLMGIEVEARVEQAAYDFEMLQKAFRRNEAFNEYGRLHRLLAYHALNQPQAPLLAIQIDGVHESLDYLFDPLLEARETLRCNRQAGSIPLSDLPLERDRRTPAAALLQLTHLDVDLVAEGMNSATLRTTETLEANAPGQKVLWLSLFSPLRTGKNSEFKLTSVRGEAGEQLPFLHAGNDLLIQLPEAWVPQVAHKLSFELKGDFLVQPTDASYWKLGIFPWFPQPPELSGHAYTVHAVAKLKKPFRPILPGRVIQEVETPMDWLMETRIDQPIQFFVMDGGKFEVISTKEGNRTVRVWSFMGGGRNNEKLGRMAHQYMELYQNMLGPFPMSDLNIIQQLEYGYGQAPPGTMYITNEAFDSVTDLVNRAYSRGVNQRFAHEIAHQYWGIQVKMPNWEEQWITEAFAEYCSALAMKRTKGFGEPKFKEMVEQWTERAKRSADRAAIPMANALTNLSKPYDAREARQNLIYFKGALLLHRLHNELGDAQFGTFLKVMVRSFQWKWATTVDVRDLATLLAKKDYGSFFDQCYWGTDMP